MVDHGLAVDLYLHEAAAVVDGDGAVVGHVDRMAEVGAEAAPDAVDGDVEHGPELGEGEEGGGFSGPPVDFERCFQMHFAADRFGGQEAVAGFVSGQVVDDEGAVVEAGGIFAARPTDLVGAGFGLEVAAPAVGAERSVDVTSADKYAAIGQLFAVGPVEGEGAHLDRRPGAAAVLGEGDEAGLTGVVILAQDAGQLLATDGVGIVELDDGAFTDAMVAVVCDCGGFVPGLAAVVGAGEDDGELLALAAHDVGADAEPAVGEVLNAVGLEAQNGGLLGFAPGFPVVVAPVEPVAGRLVFVEVAVVVVVDDNDEAAVVEAA